jgi:phosphoribosyl 1,2-cyclic phosphodiesterase
MVLKVNCLGTRGGVTSPYTSSGECNSYFGSDTPCYVLENEDSGIIIDAGTGIRSLKLDEKKYLLMFSHGHPDHIQGLGFFPGAYNKGADLIATASPEHLAKLNMYYNKKKGLFPLDFSNFSGIREVRELENEFKFGRFNIESFGLNHSQGSYGFIIGCPDEDKKVAFITDHELGGDINEFTDEDKSLIKKVSGSNLLMMDGQYTPEEYNPTLFGKKGCPKIGWGHSVDEKVIRFGKEAGIEEIVLIHHDPEHSDCFLSERQEELREKFPDVNLEYAKQGEVICV